ncbi:FUSC family protein [Acidihalobacter prosperus]|uniref:Integral membrane bound transporter domain-containing protein n=1 Tax=Acidihalobacter prosperus TaxID=160660 RepID=A0A1A6C5E1_9GAMM|nr:FUSC family protein [Acidihalobacter prosperus]OBS09778.1 hypothetical protein Thpro_020828 [Acidihalobacter prosperus]
MPFRPAAIRRHLVALPLTMGLSAAIRGTLATGIPLLGLAALHHPVPALIAALGALQTSIADVGGPYRDRAITLGLACLLLPLAALSGQWLAHWWWAATLGAAMLAVGIGLARAFGQLGSSLGFATGVAFLIGMVTPAAVAPPALLGGSLLFGAGCTLGIALIFWKLRPYKRVEYEVAECFSATTAVVDAAVRALRRDTPLTDGGALSHAHHDLRLRVEQARATLDQLRRDSDGRNLTLPRLLVLIRSAARIGANTLAAGDTETGRHACALHAQAALVRTLEQLARICRVIARDLAFGRGQLDTRPYETELGHLARALERLRRLPDCPPALWLEFEHALRALDRNRAHLRNAVEVLDQLFGDEHAAGSRLLPRLYARELLRRGLNNLRANLSPRASLFRHALRLSLAVASGTALYSGFALPHGIWIPLTVLVVLQPDIGGTRARAFQRTAGTVAGVALAGLLVTQVRDPGLINLLLLGLTFFTLLFLRRRYALAVTLLTPLIILLLERLAPSGLALVFERVAYTLAGAVLALAAGYWLWPNWQRRHLPAQLATALTSTARYAAAALDHLRSGTGVDTVTIELRRAAETDAANADAAYQRMLAEPRRQRESTRAYLALVSYNERLTRHITDLDEFLGTGEHAPLPPYLEDWIAAVQDTLARVARTTADDAAPLGDLDALEASNARMSPAIGRWDTLDRQHPYPVLRQALLEKIATDVSALYAAAWRLRHGEGPDAHDRL